MVATVPKEKSPNFSNPVDFKSRFHRIPLPSRLMQTKVNEMEKEYHADTKIVTMEESTVKQDSEIVEEKLKDVVYGEDSKDL